MTTLSYKGNKVAKATKLPGKTISLQLWVQMNQKLKTWSKLKARS